MNETETTKDTQIHLKPSFDFYIHLPFGSTSSLRQLEKTLLHLVVQTESPCQDRFEVFKNAWGAGEAPGPRRDLGAVCVASPERLCPV